MERRRGHLPFKTLDDKELFEKLHRAEMAEILRTDPRFQLLNEARNRIVERAILKFVTDDDHDNIAKTIEFKIIVKKYKYGLFSEVEQMAKEGDILFDEMQARGIELKPSL